MVLKENGPLRCLKTAFRSQHKLSSTNKVTNERIYSLKGKMDGKFPGVLRAKEIGIQSLTYDSPKNEKLTHLRGQLDRGDAFNVVLKP